MTKRPHSIRPLSFKKDYLPHAEGSCLVSMGNTKVLCVATVEDKVPPHAEAKGMGWIHAEYSMLPRSGEQRSSRKKLTTGGRTLEISRLIGRSLRAAVDLRLIPGTTITFDCDVLRADGGTRTAAINGCGVALVQALQKLKKQGKLLRWPLKHFVGAVSVGIINKKHVLDICYAEDSTAETDLNLVMAENGRIIEIQGTAEAAPFSSGDLQKMIRLGQGGIRQIIKAQKRAAGAPGGK